MLESVVQDSLQEKVVISPKACLSLFKELVASLDKADYPRIEYLLCTFLYASFEH